jgi:hypothetical protein
MNKIPLNAFAPYKAEDAPGATQHFERLFLTPIIIPRTKFNKGEELSIPSTKHEAYLQLQNHEC